MPDPLERWRAEFPIVNTCTYLVSHSLGAMPVRASRYLQEYADTWTSRGVRAWHEGWWEIGRITGDLLAPVLGVRPGTLSIHQNVTVAIRLNTPLDDRVRGGAVVVDVPEAEAVSAELIRQEIVVDYRPGAGIRMAPHFYNTESEIDHRWPPCATCWPLDTVPVRRLLSRGH